MASVTQSSMSLASLSNKAMDITTIEELPPVEDTVASVPRTSFSNPNSVSLSIRGRNFPSITLHPRRQFQVRCAAKPETVTKVCNIVKKQLALPEGSAVTGASTFSELGADSLDTVEIVMGLEEEFGISVEEESAQAITTVQEAADMIDKLIETNKA